MLIKKLQSSLKVKIPKIEEKTLNDVNIILVKFAENVSSALEEFEKKIDLKIEEAKDEIKEMPEFPINQAVIKVVESVSKIATEELKGDDGYTPEKDKDYFDGKDYVLTEEDKKDIASKIEVPIVEKIIEKVEVIKEQPIIVEKITNEVKEVAKTDEPETIATKLNTLTDKMEPSVIIGLKDWMKKVQKRLEKGGGASASSGGGMGNVTHENTSTSSATTTVTTVYKIAANGNALWLYYNGQLLMKGTHYTVGSDQKTITFLITLDDSTNVSVVYIRT